MIALATKGRNRLLKFVFSAAWLAVCPSAMGQEIPNVNVGVVLPLTGSQAAFGHEAMRGIEVGVDQFAALNPDWASRVTLKKADDRSLPEGAEQAATKLLNEQRAHVIIGSITAANTHEIEKMASKAERVVVSPITTSQTIADAKWSFSVPFIESAQGLALATLARTNLSTTRAAIIRDASAEAESFSQSFKEAYEKQGGKVLGVEIYEAGTTDFRPLLNKLKKTKPQALLIPASYNVATTIMNQAQTLGYRTRFLGGDNWDTPALAATLGPGPSRAFHLAHFAVDDPAPATQAFRSAFKEKYGRDPGAVAALAYDAYMVAMTAFQDARSSLKTPVRRAFERVSDWRGATGTLSFTPSGGGEKSVIVKAISQGGGTFFTRIGDPEPSPEDQGS